MDGRSGLWLRRRVGVVLLLVSLVPVALLAVGSWIVFRRLHLEQALELQRRAATTQAAAIDLYLNERLRALTLAMRVHSFDQLADPSRLRGLFDKLSQGYPGAFVDLGVIDSSGNHVAYHGLHRLEDRNYSDAEWFRMVMSRGTYVSDVFLGYRGSPHCIIAVKRDEDARSWILRATLNNDRIDALIRSEAPDTGADAYIVNREGLLQTSPRAGKSLDPARSPVPPALSAGTVERIRVDGASLVQAAASLNQGRWLLVLEQPEASIMGPANEAALSAAALLALVLGCVATAALLAVRHLTTRIDRANQQRDRLQDDLIRSGRLASLGEIAGGLAHEINNPLAAISAEQTNLTDLLAEAGLDSHRAAAVQASLARGRRQVRRCTNITAKMLQFARESTTHVQPAALGPVLQDLRGLLESRARMNGIEVRLDVEPRLPLVLVDPSELEQVIVNLFNNALYAVQQDGWIAIHARRVDDEVALSITDSGCGINPEDLERIFQPFFTTKPPGAGTGLGLSVCHGLVGRWGGRIEAQSQVGEGTLVTVLLRTDTGPVTNESPAAGEQPVVGPGTPGLVGGYGNE